ncbi:hypothetical protein ASPBRDRAFT_77877 [Aspergillus brasiliensis CBS 101740]|uniref:Aldehyde dehydrogenase n=1 Tax=Aspergillus brasiliensis (strain CBS 101740 / IMI 381727 / IBT 21946) TaxID=767769 RepID=A0A1L9U8Y0_ASPBC|nr:hypothetical protein ASPBRDRAFT_77877 [Aspergillus brasiliensis CBS 101740]
MYQTLQINNRTISLPTGLFINGQFMDSKQGAYFDVEDPATGQVLISIVEGREDDVDEAEAVRIARDVFDAGDWAHSDPTYQASLLNKLADLMEENKDDLVALECADTGKTPRLCYQVDFPGSVGTLRYYAGWADKVLGQSSFNIPRTFAFTKREPVGVCGQIIPWNFPMMMFIWKIAPALITGNTVVIKSAEATPLSALKICELIAKAGFPPGTINLISGYGKTVGSAIAHHMDVDKVAFTGSTATGRAILKASASSNLKKVTLELGGKSPNIIFPDADLDKAAEWSAWGINMNFGQTCHAGTRIYVHEEVYDEFLAKFTQRMKEITNSRMQYEKILGYIDSGVEEGHQQGDRGGYYTQPTIFTNVRLEMKIMREEIFGPVVAISKYSSEADVIKQANNTPYGLAAACHTKDYERAIRVTGALRAGTTWVNMYNFVHWSIPFGGYKESGIGRECGEAVLENYTHTKAVYFNMGLPCPTA